MTRPLQVKAAPPEKKTERSAKQLAQPVANPVWSRLAWGLQPKLAVSAPGDPAEQEADRIAATVMRMPEPAVQRKCAACSAGGATCPSCEEEEHVQRKADGESGASEVGSSDMSVADGDESELAALLVQITDRTRQNQQIRQLLDSLPDVSSPEREALSVVLNAGRTELITLLEQRIDLLKSTLTNLWLQLGPAPQSNLNDMRSKALGDMLVAYESQFEQHRNQLKPLLRWQMRQQIESIDTELAQIDQELAQLPQVSDPNAPEADLLAARRADLETQRKTSVKSLSSSALEYKQFDPRWGSIRYGTDPKCTNIKAAGCGPTSLAILLNYLYSEDPEALNPGTIEFVTPKETAAYATRHGRICNSGTSGPTMVTQVSTQWPGFRGKSIKLAQATLELQYGNLVIFLCRGCTGKNKSGGDKKYGGHFMVLNGVDDAGKVFNVLDPGAKEDRDIETITREELAIHTNGFWIVARK